MSTEGSYNSHIFLVHLHIKLVVSEAKRFTKHQWYADAFKIKVQNKLTCFN